MANIDALKILGSLLSSGALSRGSGSGVLGSVIGAMTGGGQSSASQQGGGGLGGLVGSVLGGGSKGGGIGDLLGGLLGGGGGSQSAGGGLGDLFGMAMRQVGAARSGSPASAAAELPRGVDAGQMEQQAELLVRAMINAAKSDGTVDREEQQKIVDQLGEVTEDEVEFVQRELATPLDTQGFVRSIPRGMEKQVYAVSLMGIDLDSQSEAQYLHQLAQGIGLDADVCNQIHAQLGVPKLYS